MFTVTFLYHNTKIISSLNQHFYTNFILDFLKFFQKQVTLFFRTDGPFSYLTYYNI